MSMYVVVVWFFFFFKQKTAYEMRISDWSSDVCSSDLTATQQVLASRRVEGKVASTGMRLGVDVEGYNYEGDNFKETPLGQAGQLAIDDAVRFIARDSRKLRYAPRVVTVDDQERALYSGVDMHWIAPGTKLSGMSFAAPL